MKTEPPEPSSPVSRHTRSKAGDYRGALLRNESKLNTPGSTRGTLRSTPSMSVTKSDEAPTQNFRGDHYIPGTGTSPDSMIQDSLTDLIGFGEEELDRDEEAFLDEVDDVNLYDAYDHDLGEPPSLEPILDGDDEEEKFATAPPRSPEMITHTCMLTPEPGSAR